MRWLGILVFLAITACAASNNSPFVSTVDDQTGQSVVYAKSPLTFVANRPNLSQVGKDYLVISPLRASIQGTSRNYLFFALGSTIDRALMDASVPSVRSIILRVDGQLMSFETTKWSALSRQAPFSVDLLVHEMLVAEFTQSEMALITRADSLSAWLLDDNDRSPEYRLLGGDHKQWDQF
ncbi:MAG: hypothetical protein AAF270_14215 [Pseudomonadota bacterium]